jgi:hypothetical protein
MEYGWGECLSDVILDLDAVENGDDNVGAVCFSNPDQIGLYDWRPPAPPMVSSTLNEAEQLASLQRQLATLTADINAHREIKKKIEVKVCVAACKSASTYKLSQHSLFPVYLVPRSIHKQCQSFDQLGKSIPLSSS